VCLVVAVAVALPVYLNVTNNIYDSTVTVSNTENKNIAKSYWDIYSKVKDFKIQAREELYITDDMAVYETETATDGAASAPATGITSDKSAATNSSDSESKEYSETNTQVDGVDEADVVKTDGNYIYSLSAKNEKIRIIKVGKSPEKVAEIPLDTNYYSSNMYLNGDRLVVYVSDYNDYSPRTVATIYDISTPEKPVRLTECVQDGDCRDTRLIGNKLYLISNYNVNNISGIRSYAPETYVPNIECKDFSGAVPADSVYINENCTQLIYTVISAFDITDGSLCSTQSILGGTYTVYCSTKNIITAGYFNNDTKITRYAINDGKIVLEAEGSLKGNLLNQFSIDEYNGYFRFVTTVYDTIESREDKDIVSVRTKQTNGLYVYDKDLKVVGKIENLAPDERVYSVRFMGNTAYFVTFRQVDPLFSADLSDPTNPKIIGALKIPGFSSYLHPYGDGKLLGIGMEADENTGRTSTVKLSLFDISKPEDVTEASKTVLDIYYSEALDNHKSVLINEKHNIIGFSGYVKNGMIYYIYSVEDGKFAQKAVIKVDDIHSHTVRGLFIDSELYIVEDNRISVYGLKDYEIISSTKLN